MKKYLFIIVLAAGLINFTSRPKLNKDLMVDELCTAFQNDEVSEPDLALVVNFNNNNSKRLQLQGILL